MGACPPPEVTRVQGWAGTEAVTIGGSIVPGMWTHLEFSLTTDGGSGTLALWIDDQQTSAPAEGPMAATETILIGSWTTDQTYDLNIDNVQLDRQCLGTCPPFEQAPVTVPTEISVPVDGTPVS